MDLQTRSEAELLGFMSRQGGEPALARAAWGELYQRHVRYIFAVVSRTYGTALKGDEVPDLVVDTFHRAHQWAGRQYSSDTVTRSFEGDTRDATRRRVLSWLCAIATSLFKDRLRARSSTVQEQHLAHEVWARQSTPASSAPTSRALSLLQEALSELSPTETEALRASLLWYDSDRGEFNFPHDEAALVAKSLGTSADALRQRRHRALKHLHEYFRRAGYLAEETGVSS